uniref:Uncharacterized protein n=1 Tax=Oryza glumipatula TaxID=40148 RepID=A0A0E0ANM4_9ORYZ
MASAMHTIRINLIRRGRLKAPLVRKKNWRASNVAQLNSRVVSIVEKPPRMTTVAHVNTRVPRPLPALSMNAMMRTKRFRCFSGGSGGTLRRRRVAASPAGHRLHENAKLPLLLSQIDWFVRPHEGRDAGDEEDGGRVEAAGNEVIPPPLGWPTRLLAAPLGQSAHHTWS